MASKEEVRPECLLSSVPFALVIRELSNSFEIGASGLNIRWRRLQGTLYAGVGNGKC